MIEQRSLDGAGGWWRRRYPEYRVRLIIWMLVWTASAQTADRPTTVKQGGVVRLRGQATAVAARMEELTIRLFPQADGGAFGLMPIPADQKPGPYTLDLLDATNAVVSSVAVTVQDAHFRKQNVVIEQSVAESKPSPEQSEDAKVFRQTVSQVRYWSEPLMLPAPGCMTSPYGVQRYLNGKPTGNIHGGLDQRAPMGTPVRAVADGVVKLVRQWALHGNTVGIDHGQGLESMYQHLSRFAVAEGATSKEGRCDRLFGINRPVQCSAPESFPTPAGKEPRLRCNLARPVLEPQTGDQTCGRGATGWLQQIIWARLPRE